MDMYLAAIEVASFLGRIFLLVAVLFMVVMIVQFTVDEIKDLLGDYKAELRKNARDNDSFFTDMVQEKKQRITPIF